MFKPNTSFLFVGFTNVSQDHLDLLDKVKKCKLGKIVLVESPLNIGEFSEFPSCLETVEMKNKVKGKNEVHIFQSQVEMLGYGSVEKLYLFDEFKTIVNKIYVGQPTFHRERSHRDFAMMSDVSMVRHLFVCTPLKMGKKQHFEYFSNSDLQSDYKIAKATTLLPIYYPIVVPQETLTNFKNKPNRREFITTLNFQACNLQL